MIECASMVSNHNQFIFSYAEDLLSIDFKTNVDYSFVDEEKFGELIQLIEKNRAFFYVPWFQTIKDLSHKMSKFMIVPVVIVVTESGVYLSKSEIISEFI